MIHAIEFYYDLIKSGRLKIKNKIEEPITVQDPCNIVRKTERQEMADDLRFVVKSIVGEENFIDMQPNRSNNFCCGGGGGFLQSGYPEARRDYGKYKYDQIKATGANVLATGCPACMIQLAWGIRKHGLKTRIFHISEMTAYKESVAA